MAEKDPKEKFHEEIVMRMSDLPPPTKADLVVGLTIAHRITGEWIRGTEKPPRTLLQLAQTFTWLAGRYISQDPELNELTAGEPTREEILEVLQSVFGKGGPSNARH